MVEKKELDDLMWHILRGFNEGFEICSVIQEGVSYKKSIPKSFWLDERKGYYGIMGLNKISKSDMRIGRDEVIERIILEINEPHHDREMYADNYSRLFHALAIFQVAKSDLRVPAIGKNYMYNIAYDLWALDDGSSEIYENHISSIAWYSAEAFKSKKFTSDSLLTGRRHNS